MSEAPHDQVTDSSQGRSDAPQPVRRYWWCHLGGWGAWAALSAPFAPWLPLVVLTLAGVVATHTFRNVIHRYGWRELPLQSLAPRIVAASVVCGGLMTVANAPWTAGQVSLAQHYVFFGSFSGISLGWFVVYFGYHYRKRLRAAEAERWRLDLAARDAELAAREAELSALRAQLNPHFLFNSLNGLRGIISVDPERAQRAVTDLSELLRFTFRLSDRPTTTLREELGAVSHYLALERLRFGERLRFELNVARGVLTTQVPPLLLQTLVENAVKHGIAPRASGGEIAIDVRAVDDSVVVRIKNSGNLGKGCEETGVGLANSRQRLRLLFGDRADLQIQQIGDEAVVAVVRLPRIAQLHG
jgi:two-component system, LytTR family, sensor kinase